MEVRPELDDAHRAVLADWLSARGDPRGELINLELALDQPGRSSGERAALLERLSALRGELEPRWVAELAHTLELTHAQLHAFMPGRWYAGLLLELALCPSAELATGDVALVLLEWILASEAAVAVEVIDAGEFPGQAILEQLATGPARPRIRRLVLGDHHAPVGPLRQLNGQLDGLRQLEVRGPGIELAGFEAPALEVLRLCCRGDWSSPLRSIQGLRCPAMTRLELRFDQESSAYAEFHDPVAQVEPWLVAGLLDPVALPRLCELVLASFVCDASLIQALVAASGFSRLRRLSLSDVDLAPNVVDAIRERSECFAGLERLDIGHGGRWIVREQLSMLGNLNTY
ncbi:WGR domain protein [Enhygromyxa salina]|uniref:WGR domain protein n=1 Tax=Enhygromyxa salina TaxID=215803 RepID=A0A0C2A3F0_9BACT|nr:hypothetical protein [Enhygromyxa salina]KIG17908.1 WGR domain protein [Enhygromyxa salina]